ncbi:MAG: pilus assembly protein [Fimbriimonadaceae bacterium]|nr:pilus assembly protein [Fimbriimonadaceae bacterium]
MTATRRLRPRGSTLVEMGVALPVFLLLVFGVFTLGTVYSQQMAINTAARDGARLAAVGHPDDVILNQVYRITPNLNHDRSRFQVAILRAENGVTVHIEYIVKVGMPVLSILFDNKKLVARAEHYYETDFVQR